MTQGQMLREADDDAVAEVTEESTQKNIRVRRGVVERLILRPVLDRLLAPAMVEEMVAEMLACYEHNRRIARLAKGREPDRAPDERLAIIRRAENKRTELLSSAPEMKPHGQGAKRNAGSGRAVSVTDHEELTGQSNGGAPRPRGGTEAPLRRD